MIEMPSVYNWLDINEQLNKQLPCCVCCRCRIVRWVSLHDKQSGV